MTFFILDSQQSVRPSGKSPITNTAIIPIEESGTAPIDRKMILVKIWFVSRQVAVDVTLGAKIVCVLSLCGIRTEFKYTTMIYTDALHGSDKGVRSPLDGLRSSPVKVSYTDLH
jgi:hypothetical protein